MAIVGAGGILGAGGAGQFGALLAQQPPYLGSQEASLIQGTPGNRLYSLDGGRTVRIAENHPGYVLGEQLAARVQSAYKGMSLLGNTIRHAFSLIQRASQSMVPPLPASIRQLFRPASATPCYTAIVSKDPSMNSDARQVIQALCANTDTALTFDQLTFNTGSEIQGVAAALAQNTVLQTLSLTATCDTATFAVEFSKVLQTNGSLRELFLYLPDIGVTSNRPSPVTEPAVQTFLQHLPCFKLHTFSLSPITFTDLVAQTALNVFQANPYFPLEKLVLSWHTTGSSFVPQFSVLTDAIGFSRCLQEFKPQYIGLGTQSMLDLFRMLGSTNQTLSTLDLWCVSPYSLNATEEETVLSALQQSPCFLKVIDSVNTDGGGATGYSCFSPDLTKRMGDIVANKTACVRDPLCDVPVNCNVTTNTTASPSISTVTQSTGFQVGVPVGGAALLVALAAINHVAKKKKALWHSPEARRYMTAIARKAGREAGREAAIEVMKGAGFQVAEAGSGNAPSGGGLPTSSSVEVVRSLHFKQKEGEASVSEGRGLSAVV